MLSALSSYWEYGNQYTGIEATTVEGSLRYFCVSSQKKKGEFEKLTFNDAGSFIEILEQLGKNRHAYLVINTDKVLIKEIELEKDISKALSKAFPGLSLNEFYFDITHSDVKSFVAVCRKEVVDTILSEAENNKIDILGLQLGFASIQPLLPIIKESEITLSRQTLRIENNSLYSFSNKMDKKNDYLIEGTKISSNYLLAVSSLFQYLLKNEKLSNTEGKNNALKKLHSQKNFFRKGFVMGVAIMLLLLLINMFYYTGYRKQYQVLQEETELASVQRKILVQKTEEVEKKDRIVNNILTSGNSKSSFYINRIVTNAPNSVVFIQISYQPLLKSIRHDKPIEYSKSTLLLKGESADKESFSLWIEKIENLEWVSNVTVSDYGIKNSKSDHFEINLTLTDDTAQ